MSAANRTSGSKALTDTERARLVEAIDVIIESARLLGHVQAGKIHGHYSRDDAIFERAHYQSIAARRSELIAAAERAGFKIEGPK